MTSYYSLVLYTADPVEDERINLGLILLGDVEGIPTVQFRQGDISRAARFMGSEIHTGAVGDLVAGIQEDLDPL